jgi:hypothetical protein
MWAKPHIHKNFIIYSIFLQINLVISNQEENLTAIKQREEERFYRMVVQPKIRIFKKGGLK